MDNGYQTQVSIQTKSTTWVISTILASEIFFLIAFSILTGLIFIILRFSPGNLLNTAVVALGDLLGVLNGIRYVNKRTLISLDRFRKVLIYIILIHIIIQVLLLFYLSFELSGLLFFLIFDVIIFILIKKFLKKSNEAIAS